MEYNGGRVESEIVSWILKKVGPSSTEVDCAALKVKVEQNKLIAAYFGDLEAKEYKETFLTVASNPAVSEKYVFVHSTDKDCAKEHGADSLPALVAFRKFDTPTVVYHGNCEVTPVVEFLENTSVPTLIEFSEDYIEPIFGQRKSAIFLFLAKGDYESTYAKVFADASQKLKGQILFVQSGVSDGIQQRLGEFIGVDETQLPTVRILDPSNNMKKFTLEGKAQDITIEQLSQFIDSFKDDKLTPFLKSQDIPAANDESVLTLVGKNFAQIVTDSDDDVLVEFYAPWCGHCKKLAPIWEEVAQELKNVPHLKLAKMDSTMNEVDGVEIKGYPTLKFYARGAKASPSEFEGERDAEGIKTFLKEHSSAYKTYLESSKSDL
jgi:protein disulfide-isomerase A1